MAISTTRRTFLRGSVGAVFASAVAGIIARGAAADTPLRVRRNASLMDPSDPFFTDYAEAVRALHDLGLDRGDGWRVQALIHLDFCPHGRPDFCAWHRHYITVFEVVCGELIGKPEFALAYWDWTANSGRLPAAFFDDGPLNVAFWNDPAGAQSANWPGGPVNTNGTRALDVNTGLQDDPLRGGAFTVATISGIQRLPDFSFFQQRLEGSPHNNGHVVAGAGGGHIGNGMSPLDPAFWLHHCNVDRIWAEWQAAGNDTPGLDRDYSSQFVDEGGDLIEGPALTADGARDYEALGFTYDTLSETVSEALGEELNIPSEGEQTALTGISIGSAQVIGAAEQAESARPLVATELPVTVPQLVPTLFQPSAFRPVTAFTEKRVAVGDRRILARLSNIEPKGPVTSLVTNVFVNCPYLSPETPYADPHYADSFAFFMPAGENASPHGREYLVDITDPLRAQAGEGRIATEEIRVQLMPLPARGAEAAAEGASYKVGKVEIVTI
jgi:tyrosinase